MDLDAILSTDVLPYEISIVMNNHNSGGIRMKGNDKDHENDRETNGDKQVGSVRSRLFL